MEKLLQLERNIQSLYDDVLLPLARRTGFDLPTSRKEAPGLPSVLFLGNHSSGKSSFINYLVEAELQKTGLAPTDDGFTIITYGEKEDAFDGQTVVTHPELAYKSLQELGPAFLARLRLKAFPHDRLKAVTLIDSPGMIDAVGSANTRGYDFAASVRFFAERADLILFFFDPDKPGTTGETVSIFKDVLSEMAYKLMIVLHKVDLFGNIRDFARTYGTLCWNLSKTIKSKDIPHIFNTYLPNLRKATPGTQTAALPLEDFDASRDEVIAEIERAPTRRADNLVSDLYKNARGLATHVKVCQAVAAKFRALRRSWLAASVIACLIGLGLAWQTWKPDAPRTAILILLVSIVVAAVIWTASGLLLQRWTDETVTAEGLEPYFRAAYKDELAQRDRADLRGWWESVRSQTLGALRSLGPGKIPYGLLTRKSLRRLERVLEEEVPKLRRSIGDHRPGSAGERDA